MVRFPAAHIHSEIHCFSGLNIYFRKSNLSGHPATGAPDGTASVERRAMAARGTVPAHCLQALRFSRPAFPLSRKASCTTTVIIRTARTRKSTVWVPRAATLRAGGLLHNARAPPKRKGAGEICRIKMGVFVSQISQCVQLLAVQRAATPSAEPASLPNASIRLATLTSVCTTPVTNRICRQQSALGDALPRSPPHAAYR